MHLPINYFPIAEEDESMGIKKQDDSTYEWNDNFEWFLSFETGDLKTSGLGDLKTGDLRT